MKAYFSLSLLFWCFCTALAATGEIENSTSSTFLQAASNTLSSWRDTIGEYWNSSQELLNSIGSSKLCNRVKCPAGNLTPAKISPPHLAVITGHFLVKNESAPAAAPNGCGSYGMLIPRDYMASFTACCDEHDHCYAMCGSKRGLCDKLMRICYMETCKTWKAEGKKTWGFTGKGLIGASTSEYPRGLFFSL